MIPEIATSTPCFMVGVDTHLDEHVCCVLDHTGRVVHEASYPTTEAGYLQLRIDAESFGPCRYAVECTSTYGHGLVVSLLVAGAEVFQAVRPNKKLRRAGKTDAVDARAAALRLVAGETLPRPRSCAKDLTDLRFLQAGRHSAVKAGAEALTQLRSLIVVSEPGVREQLRGLSEAKLLRTCSNWRPKASDHQRQVLRDLALRVRVLRGEAKGLEHAMAEIVTALAPRLRDELGVGTVSAATLLLTAGDHPERLHSRDGFAALCGTTPIEASSGKTRRHRLNRGGDRQANCAIHRAVIVRLRFDARTREYQAQCLARGKSKRDTIRLLKTYLARHLYGVLAEAILT